jgi:iron complex outermembrane receptor protein
VWGRGAWIALDANTASGYLVDDTAAARTAPWWQVDLRAGWSGSGGGWSLRPFVALLNVFDSHYVSSVVINAARGRYYEPAPGRNAYVGVEVSRPRPPALPGPRRRM